MRFKGKTVLVTGGATGIGRATARAFAREGASVAIGDISDLAAETVQMIEREGGRAFFQATDVASYEQVKSLVEAAVKRFDRLDAAFNNAAILPATQPLHAVRPSDFDRIIAVNLRGVFNAMHAEIAYMLGHGGGAIVNTASVAGVVADPGMSPYVASKHARSRRVRSAGQRSPRRWPARCCTCVPTPRRSRLARSPSWTAAKPCAERGMARRGAVCGAARRGVWTEAREG